MAIDTSSESHNVPRLREAHERLANEIAAVPEDELATINIDILAAATTAMGALAEIMALRPRFVTELPELDIDYLDKLEPYALAAAHAHTQYLGADTPAEAIPELSEEAVETRGLLLSDASALAKRGYLNPSRLLELKGTNGYRNTASDVLTIAGILRDNWSKISGKTCVTLEELNSAESLGYRLLNAVGSREQGPAMADDDALTRQRVYTLFSNAYDQVRRAVCYLRWNEGDIDEIAPSLYAGRGGKKKAETDVDQPPVAVPGAVASVVADNMVSPAVAAAAVAATKPAIGLPGADPFAH